VQAEATSRRVALHRGSGAGRWCDVAQGAAALPCCWTACGAARDWPGRKGRSWLWADAGASAGTESITSCRNSPDADSTPGNTSHLAEPMGCARCMRREICSSAAVSCHAGPPARRPAWCRATPAASSTRRSCDAPMRHWPHPGSSAGQSSAGGRRRHPREKRGHHSASGSDTSDRAGPSRRARPARMHLGRVAGRPTVRWLEAAAGTGVAGPARHFAPSAPMPAIRGSAERPTPRAVGHERRSAASPHGAVPPATPWSGTTGQASARDRIGEMIPTAALDGASCEGWRSRGEGMP
jgi:hypothetical protein